MENKSSYIWLIIIVILFSSMMISENKIVDKKPTNKNKIMVFNRVNNIIQQNIQENIKKIITDDTKISENINQPEVQTEKEKPKVKLFVCPTPKKDYDDMWLYNVGQNTSLPDTTYIPKDLKKIPSLYSARINICLTSEALDNLETMLSQAKDDGYDIKVTSAFRSFDYQTGLLNTAIDGGNTDANLSIAKPGYSEHQLGTAVDLSGGSINFSGADNAFNDTEEAKWLEKNASDYGFIESYPKDKTDITGYIYEPWHYRYVGFDNAKLIIKNKQTISEFLTK